MASRVRSQIEWDDARDRALLRDLGRFRGRAIGRRIKELMVLGLEAERLGMRVVELDGLPTVQGARVAALVPSIAAATSAAEIDPSDSGQAAGDLDAEHQAGLEGLLEGLGIEFG